MDDVADGDDEVPCLPSLYDSLDDTVHVGIFILVVRVFVKELFDDVCELLGQGFADLASRVLAADGLADQNEAQECIRIEVREVVVSALFYHLEPFLRIVNEGTEVAHHVLWKRAFEEVIDLSLDVAAGIAKDVEERFVFAMDVGHEMLCAFRKTEYRLEVYDFRACALAVRERLGKQLQQPHVGVIH